MPPRAVKRTPARAAKSARKQKIQPEEKIDQGPVSVAEVEEEIKVVEQIVQQEKEDKHRKSVVESKSEANRSLSSKG